MRTIVKPCDVKSPFYNCLGEVRAIYKDSLFLFFAKTHQQHLLRRPTTTLQLKLVKSWMLVMNRLPKRTRDSSRLQNNRVFWQEGLTRESKTERLLARLSTSPEDHLKATKGKSYSQMSTQRLFRSSRREIFKWPWTETLSLAFKMTLKRWDFKTRLLCRSPSMRLWVKSLSMFL